jgi:hypothetical protein
MSASDVASFTTRQYRSESAKKFGTHLGPRQVTIPNFRLPLSLVPCNRRSLSRIDHLSILGSDRNALRRRSHALLRRRTHCRNQRLTLCRRLQSILSIVRPLPRRVELEPLHEWLRFSNADSMAFVFRKVPRCVNLILQRFSLSDSHEVRNRTHHARDPSNGPSIRIHQRSLIQRAESRSMRLQATFGRVPVGLPLRHRGGRGVKIERHVERV